VSIGVQIRGRRTLDDAPLHRATRANQPGLKKINLRSAVHLPLDEFDFGDVAFGLTVGPRLDQRSVDRGDVFGDAYDEGGDQALARCGNPGDEIG